MNRSLIFCPVNGFSIGVSTITVGFDEFVSQVNLGAYVACDLVEAVVSIDDQSLLLEQMSRAITKAFGNDVIGGDENE